MGSKESTGEEVGRGRNEDVEMISKKVQEIRLKWYGHGMRKDEEYVGKRVMWREGEGKEDRSGGGWTV